MLRSQLTACMLNNPSEEERESRGGGEAAAERREVISILRHRGTLLFLSWGYTSVYLIVFMLLESWVIIKPQTDQDWSILLHGDVNQPGSTDISNRKVTGSYWARGRRFLSGWWQWWRIKTQSEVSVNQNQIVQLFLCFCWVTFLFFSLQPLIVLKSEFCFDVIIPQTCEICFSPAAVFLDERVNSVQLWY